MILSNRELSPNICKLMPNLRLSSLQSQRPSVYQKFEIPDDPLKEALRAIENKCLSVKRIKKEDKLPQSPYRNRDSIYTPCGDPNERFLKRLEEFKLKQLQKTVAKSSKKVTFNLNIQECTPKNICDTQHNALKNSENRLMQINEKSEARTINSPQCGKNDVLKVSDIASNHEDISNEIIKAYYKGGESETNNKNSVYTDCKETEVAKKSDTTSDSNWKTIANISSNNLFHQNREASLQKLKGISCWNYFPDFVCHNKISYDTCKNDQVANTMQLPEQKKLKKSGKIYTPKPISFSVKSKMNQNYSPEFLVNGKSTMTFDLAPICTPFVLKGQAKNITFSPEVDEGPIPLKLDFDEEEKDTPKKESCKSHTLAALDNIVTIQKKLDYLADQECHLSLLNENFPVICGRCLTNPVAEILNEGDDMHFIPVRL